MSYRLLYQNFKTNKKIYLFIAEYIYKFYRQKIYFVPITLIIVKLVLPLVFFQN